MANPQNTTEMSYGSDEVNEYLRDYYDEVEDSEHQEETKRGYKLYNFKRPDKFSKDHLKGIQDIHREFSRQMSMIMTGYLSGSIALTNRDPKRRAEQGWGYQSSNTSSITMVVKSS